ncbi:MAG: PEP-CTERM sorting domain-containing protein [Planctomycetota bacterium]
MPDFKTAISAAACFLVASVTSFASGDLVLSSHSFEASTAGTGNAPAEMEFTGTFGDQDSTFFGISSTAPLTGSLSYVVDLGNNGGSSGFGGSFSGVNHNGLAGTLTTSSRYTISAWFREDAADPFTGGGEVNVHLEFYDISNALLFRTDSAGIHEKLNSSMISTAYQQLTHNYTLNNAVHISDPALVNRVAAVVTASNGGNTGDGTVYIDDFQFSTIPEPSSLLMLGLFVGAGAARRTRSK